MRNIILFFAKHGSTFLFIVLELLCFFLIVSYNNSQRSIYLHSSNLISGKLYEEKERFRNFFRLSDQLDSLQHENARLLRRVLYHEGYGRSELIDTTEFNYELTPAKIINQTVNSRNNYLTIDKGSLDGISSDMGVIDKDGVIGIVQNTNSQYSRVLSLLNSKTRISARVKNKGYFGNLIWKTLDTERMDLEAIPTHANVAVGDSVVTSGYSTMFPPNIFIGTIETYNVRKGASNYSIVVRLNTDFSRSNHVFVINNTKQFLQKDIEEQ